jgi:crotonobetainyl-CoA:carnitine CoA-transferase CaiB-like acyl-CoA transferase
MDQVLTGFRVVDFSHYIAGPYTAMLLAEQGAEVIKVEPPGGDPFRKAPGFMVVNRSKKAVTLDLKKAGGRDAANALIKQADVVITSFRPGVADRLGIGYESVRSANPRAVYCAISGFGQTGPYRDIPGWDPIVAAYAGAYAEQGGGENNPPVYLVLPLASYYAAFMAAFGIATALFARELTGNGQQVDVSLFQAIVAAQSIYILDFENKFRIPATELTNQQGIMPLYKLYCAKDGKWFFLALGNPTFFTKFALAMDHDEWLIDPLFEGAPFLILPPRNKQLIEMFEKIFAEKTRDEWLAFLQSEDIPCAPALSVEEFISDPQIIANRMVVEIEEHGIGMAREMGVPVTLGENPGSVKGPSPKTGEHTVEILRDLLGYSPSQIRQLKETGVC